MERMTGVIFSDLGQASSFMALAWVQEMLRQHLGYNPFPATLNLRPEAAEDAQVWERVRSQVPGIALAPPTERYCRARLYRVEIAAPARSEKIAAAILLPEVNSYPQDKIEVVAPMRLKERLGVDDGDRLILEFLN